jgi:UDP:flavonoid glycosyltransferase YjiC (YdhE family)
VGEEADYMAVLTHPDLWKPFKGTSLVFRLTTDAMRPFFDEISKHVRQPGTVLVSPFHLFAARAAREKFRVPLITLHLQPTVMLSAHDETLFFPGMEWVTKLPVWLKRLLYQRVPNPADLHVAGPLRRFCKEIGITPPRRVLPEWLHSPDGTLLLWPEWFAPRQPDWPDYAIAAGFPLEDLRGQFALPAELEAFLKAGDKPVLLSPGTGNAQARDFFAAGLAACEKLGKRALLGTRFPEQLPQPLPAWARHFDYLPFSAVMPHTAAVVHHGGIGTMSQAFAAGVPQLIMPMGHDQPDNALRARRLGVAADLTVRRFTAKNVAVSLEQLLGDPKVPRACAEVARNCQQSDAATVAVAMLEKAALGSAS